MGLHPSASFAVVQLAATFSDPNAAMNAAIDIARTGAALGELGIGAIVVDADYNCIAARHDEVRSSRDPLRHAGVLALRDAAAIMESWRLLGCELVVTREPCALCAGAALSARLRRVIVGAVDLQFGCLGSRYNLGSDPRLNHEFEVSYMGSPELASSVYATSIGGSPL